MDALSLYLDLEKGEKADLARTAQAMIAFSELIHECAAYVDPLSEFKLAFVSGTEGSLSIDSILEFFGNDKTRTTAAAVFSIVSIWLGGKALDFTWEKISSHIWEKVVGEEGFTDKQKEEIRNVVKSAVESKVGEKQTQRLYREVSKDKAVKGIGVTNKKGTKPNIIVPRADFAKHAGLIESKDATVKRRVRIEIEKVVLISPVLIDGKRRWKFKSKEGEFGAPIKDEHFLQSVLSGQIPIIMRRNVEMEIEIETTEDYENGVWVPKERSVIRIIGTPRQFQGDQKSLFEEKD